MKKIFRIGIVLIFIMMFVVTNIYAFSIGDLNGNGSNTQSLKTTGNKTITIISIIDSFISVIVLIILGIKYMLGSVEEKAQYKETMMPYLIGAVLVFGITNVLAIVSELAKSI